ncbi:Uncharacterised protein [Mycobacteroides abscessus subsp. abscessus]|nr:Uncharacterised protein [Mycobacteroides abscessus subsp. abscessus]
MKAVDGAITTTGPDPEGGCNTTSVGSQCSGPTTTASAGQSGRGTSRAGSVAISLRMGPGSRAGSPISTRACERCRRPWSIDFWVSRRMSPSRNLPRKPTPGASPLPKGGNPFDGRYSGCGFSSTHGTPSSSPAIPPQAVMTSDTMRSGASALS